MNNIRSIQIPDLIRQRDFMGVYIHQYIPDDVLASANIQYPHDISPPVKSTHWLHPQSFPFPNIELDLVSLSSNYTFISKWVF